MTIRSKRNQRLCWGFVDNKQVTWFLGRSDEVLIINIAAWSFVVKGMFIIWTLSQTLFKVLGRNYQLKINIYITYYSKKSKPDPTSIWSGVFHPSCTRYLRCCAINWNNLHCCATTRPHLQLLKMNGEETEDWRQSVKSSQLLFCSWQPS